MRTCKGAYNLEILSVPHKKLRDKNFNRYTYLLQFLYVQHFSVFQYFDAYLCGLSVHLLSVFSGFRVLWFPPDVTSRCEDVQVFLN